jgi:deoxycytidine triphosphate deaminase
MFLSDKDILNEIKKGNLKIESFDKERLTSNGYDLSISEISKNEANVFEKTNEFITIDKDELIKVKTLETITLGENIVAFMYLRSRYTREGLLGMFAVVDAGFNGKIIASIKNLSGTMKTIKAFDGVIHIVFAKLQTKAEHPYGSTEKSHFQNQK